MHVELILSSVDVRELLLLQEQHRVQVHIAYTQCPPRVMCGSSAEARLLTAWNKLRPSLHKSLHAVVSQALLQHEVRQCQTTFLTTGLFALSCRACQLESESRWCSIDELLILPCT